MDPVFAAIVMLEPQSRLRPVRNAEATSEANAPLTPHLDWTADRTRADSGSGKQKWVRGSVRTMHGSSHWQGENHTLAGGDVPRSRSGLAPQRRQYRRQTLTTRYRQASGFQYPRLGVFSG